ncbi:MAG: response regulator [Labilithrix sp.]|nr:response regulator [Labilithrix sp.]MBX3221607.1 response regulator [Labilithrix sp.]
MFDGKLRAARREHGSADEPVRGGGARRSAEDRVAASVLIVDDVEDNRDLYATYFEHSGFDADQACDGEEALAKIAKAPPDVVIMDLSMPKLDGWEATRLIKSNPRTTHVIVIVVTGNSTPANVEAARAAGADDVCTKPCLPRDLLECVRRRLEQAPRRTR